MSRRGKIARLPASIREQVNRRLENGENGRVILDWLNAQEEVKAILMAEFDGQEINDVNLTHWRQGGYRDWEWQQTALDETRRVAFEGQELAETGGKPLAEMMAAWLMGRYIVATRAVLENGDPAAAWKLLREMCHDVVALRRGDHAAERARIAQERLKLRQQQQESTRDKIKEEVRAENPPCEPLSEEEQERRWGQIFGFDPATHPMLQKYHSMRDEAEAKAAEPPPDPTVAPSDPVKASQSDPSPEPEPVPVAVEPQDPEIQELQRLTHLAVKGDAHSAYCLGARYRDGRGVAKDRAKAREWLGVAASRGLGAAKRELHVLNMRPD